MSELETRENIRNYLNCDLKEAELLNYYDLMKCIVCDYVMLEEDAHENIDGYYCDTCWESK